jgi:lipopolysaccharide/colanic/teichoic acid biosynthesis glycosyltransferase
MVKRCFDILFSIFVLVLLGPALLIVAAIIRWTSAGPIFYRGERVGLGGRRFRIFKFRTMVRDADRIGGSSTAEDDPRITRVGHFLRRFKLDELPQFLNVLAGDMSIVGPRPQVAWAVELYTSEERRLLEVKPGITDHASIKFRDEGEILKGAADPDRAYLELIAPEKIRLGLEYVNHHNIWIDMQIILQTIFAAARPGRGM